VVVSEEVIAVAESVDNTITENVEVTKTEIVESTTTEESG